MSTLKYELYASDCKSYVRVDVVGEITASNATEFAEAAFRLACELGTTWFLFDMREARNTMSTIDVLRITRSPDGTPSRLLTAIREVILTRPGDRSHDLTAEIVRNRGVQVYMTTDESIGIEWLTGGMDTTRPD